MRCESILPARVSSLSRVATMPIHPYRHPLHQEQTTARATSAFRTPVVRGFSSHRVMGVCGVRVPSTYTNCLKLTPVEAR